MDAAALANGVPSGEMALVLLFVGSGWGKSVGLWLPDVKEDLDKVEEGLIPTVALGTRTVVLDLVSDEDWLVGETTKGVVLVE